MKRFELFLSYVSWRNSRNSHKCVVLCLPVYVIHMHSRDVQTKWCTYEKMARDGLYRSLLPSLLFMIPSSGISLADFASYFNMMDLIL